MDGPTTCVECGCSMGEARVRREFQGVCPGCLVREAGLAVPERQAGELFTLGRYRAVRLLGRGGMGAVYETVDTSTGRSVALKILADPAGGIGGSKEDEARFLEEARMCASVGRHPNLVSVIDAGILEGRRFIAMELVPGVSLGEWGKRPEVSTAARVEALRDVLTAVHHIHERGVIHRDLKPSNVILDETGKARLVDFGIARRTREGEGGDPATTGHLAGTPSYMSPQQGMGSVDRRADVYSAGAILYELLTGRLPHEGGSTMEVLLRAATEPPKPPSQVATNATTSGVDPALDRICLKALAREASGRYATAQEFADELTKWLHDSRRARSPRRMARVPLILVGVIALVLGAVLFMREDPPPPDLTAPSPMSAAIPSLPTKEGRILRGHRGQVVRVAFSPDGRTLASSGSDGVARLWDPGTGLLRHSLRGKGSGWVRGMAWSPQGDVLATGGQLGGHIHLWNPDTGRPLSEVVQPGGKAAGALAFGREGALLVSSSEGEGIAHLWNIGQGRLDRTLTAHQQVLLSIVFGPDGRTMATGSLDHSIKTWNVAEGKELWSIRPGCQWAGDALGFSADGRFIVSEQEDRVGAIWEASTGRLVRTLEGHEKHINAAVFARDGTWLATVSHDETVRLWSMATGECLQVLEGHRGWVRAVDISPDGTRVASGGTDGTIRIWEIPDEGDSP